MNVTAILIFLIWIACAVLVIRFVLHTGGHTIVGYVAHWFGGLFVMVGLAVGMVWTFSAIDGNFRDRFNIYLLTHQFRPVSSEALIQAHTNDRFFTVYRQGSINSVGQMESGRVILDETQTTRTSLWWLLWSASYPTR